MGVGEKLYVRKETFFHRFAEKSAKIFGGCLGHEYLSLIDVLFPGIFETSENGVPELFS